MTTISHRATRIASHAAARHEGITQQDRADFWREAAVVRGARDMYPLPGTRRMTASADESIIAWAAYAKEA